MGSSSADVIEDTSRREHVSATQAEAMPIWKEKNHEPDLVGEGGG